MQETVSDAAVEATEDYQSAPFDSTGLQGELANEPSLRNFDTVDKLANSYVHAVKKMGAPPENFMKIPQEGESWDQVYDLMGRPQEPNGYQFDDFGDDFDGELNGFKTWAHELGLNNNQALGILHELNNQIASSKEESENGRARATEEGLNSLRQEWPKEVFDEELDYSRRGFTQFATKEDMEFMEETGLGDNPHMIKLFNRIGRAMSEAGMVVGQSTQVGDLTPQAAKDRIKELYNDKEFLEGYRDMQHPKHKEATQRLDRLFKISDLGH